MARRSILSSTERDNLIALSDWEDDLIRHYSFTQSDLSVIGVYAEIPENSVMESEVQL
jgi:hypothetical protein